MNADETPDLEPHWGVIGNIVQERLVGAAGEPRSGTRMFRPGAKVHFHSAYRGMGAEQITVVGQHRGSRQLVTTVVDHRAVTNWRAKMVYQPEVLRRLAESELRRSHSAHQTDAVELAARLQRHRDSALRAIDRPPHEIDELIDTWGPIDDPDLQRVRDFAGDRGMVLLEGDRAMGVGKSTSHGGRALWVNPNLVEFRPGLGREILTNRSNEVPAIALSPAQQFAYRTGLPQERYGQIVHELDRADELSARVLQAVESKEPALLTEFVSRVVLTIPELGWPPREPVALIEPWLRGDELTDLDGITKSAVQALRDDGPKMTRAALFALVLSRGQEPTLAGKIASSLEVRRISTGTPSGPAHDAIGRTYPGAQPLDRLSVSRHWHTHAGRTEMPSASTFSQYLRQVAADASIDADNSRLD